MANEHQHQIFRRTQFGDLIVYQRGPWAKKERLPAFFVLRESDGHTLEEFRHYGPALEWAKANA